MFKIANMRSDHTREDRTAAAQIRDAAMELYAERGFDAVTVRDIAARAGVSAALVIHHFGSKAGLRAAVDERAMAVLDELFSLAGQPEAMSGDATSLMAMFSEVLDEMPELLGYLRRLIVAGGPTAERLFRGLFVASRDMLAQMEAAGAIAASPDPEARAALLIANDLGAVVLRDQIRSVLGVDPMRGEGLTRWSDALLDLYTRGLFRVDPESQGGTT